MANPAARFIQTVPLVFTELAGYYGGTGSFFGPMNDRQEWQLTITTEGEIFVQHLVLPRFTMQIIIEGHQPDISVRFKGKWIDREQGGFDWYFKALEFYNNSPKPPPDTRA